MTTNSTPPADAPTPSATPVPAAKNVPPEWAVKAAEEMTDRAESRPPYRMLEPSVRAERVAYKAAIIARHAPTPSPAELELNHLRGRIGLFAEKWFLINNNLSTDETFKQMEAEIVATSQKYLELLGKTESFAPTPSNEHALLVEELLTEAVQLIDDRIEGDPGDEQGTRKEWKKHDREIAEYKARVEQLKIKVLALPPEARGEQDKERLDWLEKLVYPYSRPPMRRVAGTQWTLVVEHEHGQRPTLRQAIDAARRAGSGDQQGVGA